MARLPDTHTHLILRGSLAPIISAEGIRSLRAVDGRLGIRCAQFWFAPVLGKRSQ